MSLTRLLISVLLVVIVGVVVWVTTAGDDAKPTRDIPPGGGPGADPELETRAPREADEDSAPDGEPIEPASETPAARRVAEALEHLRRQRALQAAGKRSPIEVGAAERALWLARAAAGEIPEKDAWREIARLDALALADEEARLAAGVGGPWVVWPARVRWHQSRRRAGDPGEKYEALRAEYLEFLKGYLESRIAQGKSSPKERNRGIVEACLEFPLGDDSRDADLESAVRALRDQLIADLQYFRDGRASGERVPPSRMEVAVELELLEFRLLLDEIDARAAHTEKARIYDRALRELERREVGLVPSPTGLAKAKLRLHREKYILGDEDAEYVVLRRALVRQVREQLDAEVANAVRSHAARSEVLAAFEKEFPPAEELVRAREE